MLSIQWRGHSCEFRSIRAQFRFNSNAFSSLLTESSRLGSVQLTFATKEIDVTEWKGDLLAVGVTEKDLRKDQNSKFENPILKKLDSCLGGVLAEVSTKGDFTGKSGQSTVIRLPGLGSKRVGLFGLGQSAFDSGGYNIKTGPGYSIELMKVGMGGSAAVLGAAKAIGRIKPSGVEVHFIVAACENMISGTGMRPGDIVTASNGKTIEVNNTDAEGRLILADALVYASGILHVLDLMSKSDF